MQNVMSDEEIEELALSNGQQNGEAGGEPPSGSASGGVDYEFTMSAQSGKEAVGKGLKAAKAGTKVTMATRRAIERRKEINRQARRAKMKDGLQILGLLTSFFT